VEWSFTANQTIVLTTLRPVGREELFISYLPTLEFTRDERQEMLEYWFPECQCSKCKAEKEEPMVDCEKNDELVLATIAAHEDKDPDWTGVEEQDSESGYGTDHSRSPKRQRRR
jgi:hypothetical protein